MLKEVQKEMDNVIIKLNDFLSKIKLDKNLRNIISNLSINYYGNKMCLYQISSITEQGNSIFILPWDKECIKNISDAIIHSGLNLIPIISSSDIKINFPFMSEERRLEIIKEIKKKIEDFKKEIRIVRRNFLSNISFDVKNKILSLDEEKKKIKIIQNCTDEYILKIDKIFFSKKKEILI